jgi:hypothetical protein
MSYNQNSGYGAALLHRLNNVAASVCPTFGRILVVMSPSDTADPNYQTLEEVCKVDPEGNVRFFTTLLAAYTAATTNNNDVILMDAHSVHVIASQIAWSKSRIHVVGMEGSGRFIQQGTRIQGTVGAATAALIKVTGTRNTFRNIKFIQNDTNAAAINVIIAAGEGTLYQDCSFIFEVTNNLNLTTACEVLIAEDSGTFRRCVFGNDCIQSSAARYVTELNTVTGSASGDSPKNNTWIDCMWTIASTSSSAIFFKTTAAKFRNTLINPVFHAIVMATGSAVTLTKAMASIATMTDGHILVVNPACNTTDLCTTSTNLSVVGMNMVDATTTATVGIAITPA